MKANFGKGSDYWNSPLYRFLSKSKFYSIIALSKINMKF